MARQAAREAAARWRPDSPESLRLACWLRGHRLTVLIGDAPDDTTALLTGGLLPLLGRRSADAAIAAERPPSGVVVPFRERRVVAAGAEGEAAEILILSDAAREPTLESLSDRFDVSTRAAGCRQTRPGTRLVQRIRVLSARHGSRFLFVFDNGDALVEPGAMAAGAGAMIDELADVLAAPVDAHIVIAWDAGSRDELGPFLARLSGATPMVLDLSAPKAQPPRPVPAPIVVAAAPPVRTPEPPREPELDEQPPAGVSAFDADLPPEASALPHTDAPPALPSHPAARASRRSAAFMAAGAIGLVVLLGVGAWVAKRQDASPIAAMQPSDVRRSDAQPSDALLYDAQPADPQSVASPVAAVPAPPSLELLVDAEAGQTPRTAIELAAALGSDGSTPVRARTGRLLEPSTTAGSSATSAPRLALVRYDVLDAAARSPAAPAFEVIAPLYTDELIALVRADSTRRVLADLAGARIDAGPPGAARAVAAEALYRSLFGTAMPRTDAAAVDASAALGRLVGGGGPDAVLLTGAQARALLPTLAPRERAALKLLDWPTTTSAANRAASKTYLRARPADLGAQVVTPASLVFLVATAPRDDVEERQLGALAGTLCARLGDLRREGDAKWREVTPGLQLPLPWRSDGAGAAAWARCAPDGRLAASSTPMKPTSGDRP